ncbi:outer membrane protein transport protein [candidate division KSB1 bacterium]|nr:outer membrane protein transport protein [candidate division KSB1 bacterium]
MRIKILRECVFIFSVLILMLHFTGAPAQEEIFFLGEETGVGARAMSMGGAFLGVADDYSAVYWNPSGLGQLRRMEMNIGFSHNVVSNDATFLDEKFNSEISFTRLNSIGFVFPVPTYQGSLVFAAGYNKIRDFDNTLEIDGFNKDYAAYQDLVIPTYYDQGWTTTINDSLYQEESLIEEGTMNQFVLSGAVEIQQNFFLGASINFISGKDDYGVKLTETDVYNIYDKPFDSQTGVIADLDNWVYNQGLVSDFSATSFKLGALYHVNKATRIGATVVFPTQYTIKESWSENFDETYDWGKEDPFTDSGEYEYKIQEPYSLGVGGSFKLLNIMLAASLEFKDWSQAKFKTEPPIFGVTKGDVNVRIKQELKSVTTMHLGAEVYVPLIKGRVRAGYFNNPSPYKYTEIKPDKDYLTAGASIMLDKQVMVDVGLTHGSWEQQTYDPLTNTSSVEDKGFNKITGTLSIRF